MSVHGEDQEEKGASACPPLSGGKDELELEEWGGEENPDPEPPSRAKWSLGVGLMEGLEEDPSGVNVSRRRGRRAEWEEDQQDNLVLADALRSIKAALEVVERREGRASEGRKAATVGEEDDPAEPPGSRPQASPAASPTRRRSRGRGTHRRHRVLDVPPLGQKYNGDPKGLRHFLTQVWQYMEDYGEEFPDEASKVRAVTRALEGTAADWMVGIYNSGDPVMSRYDEFMAALRARFEDPLAERKARNKIKTLTQGGRSVVEYTQEFRDLVTYVSGYPAGVLLEYYLDGLNDEVYQHCVARRAPRDLNSWYKLAAEVEIDLARSQRKLGRSYEKVATPVAGRGFRRVERPGEAKPRMTACFRCGKGGHRAAECYAKPVPKGTPTGGGKPDKPVVKEAVRQGTETVEVAPPKGEELGPPVFLKLEDSDPDEGFLVSPASAPFYLFVTLWDPESRAQGKMLALLDSGCTRNLISPEVVEKMGLKLQLLDDPIEFCQLDGSVAGGKPARHGTQPVVMSVGAHRETITFIVGPSMDKPLILGMPWLRKWNPEINWRSGVMRIPHGKGGDPWPVAKRPPDTVAVGEEKIAGEEKIPKEYWDLKGAFSEKASDKLPPHRPTDCSIEIRPGVKLPKPKMYSLTPRELDELRRFIDKNLARGFIQPARPRVAAPILFREKKDGSLRLCVDYRNLNTICVENVYPLPLMKDMLAYLAKGKIFTKLDLREAYYRVRIKEGDEWKTAFNCPLGCFQFRVLPFGLQGAPGVFMQLINEVLHEHLYKGVLVYLDDVLIYTETLEEHVKLVRAVLEKLKAAELYAKLSKCEFHQSSLDYLGYRISHEGVEMDPGKVKAVLEWAAPRTRKQLQSFLGFANFYRQFIPSFAQIALPITDLLRTKGEGNPKPSKPLEWSMECQAAFEKLKRLFAAEPILKHPDLDAPFVVQVDASDVAVGAVLLQKDGEGALRPCAYTSRKLTETERRWAVWEKEAFAVRWALVTWRHFLEGSKHPFEVWTDHKNLEALKTPRKLSPKQARWAQHFARFNFSLRYLPGGKNFMADALSRLPQYNSARPEVVQPVIPASQLACPVVTRSQKAQKEEMPGDLQSKLGKALETDEWFKAHSADCTVREGLAWVGPKLYVPSALRRDILERVHDSKIAGHFGFVKTLHLARRQFWWPSMKKDIETYVASCPVCAAAKRPPGKPQGLLQTVARPGAPWKEISMDFIGELPESGGNTIIWVVTDLFSKQVHFVACPKMPTARALAKLFIQHVYRLHGVPERIISDRGVQFTSGFWKEFLTLIGSAQGLSSAHHPQTNGACERANSVLEQYLRCFINYQQDNWSELLPFAEVAYNNSVHSSTGFTPFRVANGQEFVPIPELPQEELQHPTLKEWISHLRASWPVARKALDEAHEAHKVQADKKRVEPVKYQVGDRVFLSTKFLQTTQKSKKLGPKYVGPFPIVKIVNPVAVQLDLPKMLRRIHPVFHVSLLKPEKVSDLRPEPENPPTPILIEGEQHFEVKEILDSRKMRGKVQYLVAWKHFPASQAEWVNESDMRAQQKIEQYRAKYPDRP